MKQSFQDWRVSFFDWNVNGLRSEVESAQGGDGLAEGDAAVVGGDALVPVRTESFGAQAVDGAFGEEAILETAAGEEHAFLAGEAGGGNDQADEGVVEVGGDLGSGNASLQVREDRFDDGGPIEDERRGGGRSWRGMFGVRGHVRALARRDMSRRGKAATCRRTPQLRFLAAGFQAVLH
jgi:hypothetical protein